MLRTACGTQVFAHLEAGEGEAVATALDGNTVEGGGVRSTFSAVFTDATVPGAESVYASVGPPARVSYPWLRSHRQPTA